MSSFSSFATPEGFDIWDIQFDSQEGTVTTFWGTDQSTNRLVRFNSTGSVLEWFAGPGSQPTGVTSAFGALWVADWTTDLIYQVNLTTHETIFFPAPDSQVWGLTFNSRSLWTNGRDSLDAVYWDPNTGGVVQSFDTPIVARPNNSGVAWDGHDLWIGLYEDGKLLRVDGGQPENLSVVVDQNGNPVSGEHGVCQLGTVTGTVFNDRNSNGSQDSGEQGLAGWRIYLDQNGNGAYDTTEKSATSSADGSYALAKLRPGAYAVGQVLQPGYTGSTETVLLTVHGSGQAVTQNFANHWTGFGPVGPELRINTTTVRTQSMPAVAMDGQGNSVAIWQGPSVNSMSPIYAQRYNWAGCRPGNFCGQLPVGHWCGACGGDVEGRHAVHHRLA